MDLRSYCRVLRRRWLVLLGTFILVVAALGGGSFLLPAAYTATVQMVFTPNLPPDSTVETRQIAELYLAARMKTYAQLVTTDPVLQPVIDNQRLGVTVPQLVEKMEVTIPADTSVINLSVTAPTAEKAAATANQIAGQMQVAVTNLEGAATVIQVSVLQPAAPPQHRSSPNIKLNLAVAFVLAVLAAVFAAVLVDNFDTRVRRRHDVTSSGVAYLGGIPNVRRAKAEGLSQLTDQKPELQATFRRIADDVRYELGGRPAYVLFTSPNSGADKTMVAASIASALAEAGNRVVFVDADVRGGGLAAQIGITQTRGITDLVAGDAAADESFFSSSWGGFTVVPSGESAINIGDMLAGKKFGDVMTDFGERFDVIVVDGPPITTSSDASRFTQNISNVVVVAEAVNTLRAELMRAVGSSLRTGAKVVGAVLTRVRKIEEPAPPDEVDLYDDERPDRLDQRPRHGR
jgi:polysaccharide biosynthesis transport protein